LNGSMVSTGWVTRRMTSSLISIPQNGMNLSGDLIRAIPSLRTIKCLLFNIMQICT
jgi:hypothetical protein